MRSSIFILGVLAVFGLGLMMVYRFELAYYRNREWIAAAAGRYQVSPKLIAAVIWQETRFNPSCRGKAGEIGLMQVMPGSAREWATSEHITAFDPENLLDPGTNILAGTWYLGRALKRWQAQPDPAPYALAEYNAGRSNAIRWDRLTVLSPVDFTQAIDYPKTRAYVRAVMRNYHSFWQPWKRWGKE